MREYKAKSVAWSIGLIAFWLLTGTWLLVSVFISVVGLRNVPGDTTGFMHDLATVLSRIHWGIPAGAFALLSAILLYNNWKVFSVLNDYASQGERINRLERDLENKLVQISDKLRASDEKLIKHKKIIGLPVAQERTATSLAAWTGIADNLQRNAANPNDTPWHRMSGPFWGMMDTNREIETIAKTYDFEGPDLSQPSPADNDLDANLKYVEYWTGYLDRLKVHLDRASIDLNRSLVLRDWFN